MNEDLPPPNDPATPEREVPPRTQRPESYQPPNFWGMVALGFLLLVLCCFLCAPLRGPSPLIFGGVLAFVSLFGRGYRGVFVGFAVPIALAFLLLVAICGNSHPSL